MMSADLFLDLLQKTQMLNQLARHLTGHGVFESNSLPMPRFQPAELGFLRSVSWLYVSYFEAGRVGVLFLLERLKVYELNPNEQHRSHYELVQRLRTYLQHNLHPDKNHDAGIQRHSREWFERACRTSSPELEESWQTCIHALLAEAVGFFNALVQCVRHIEQDESRQVIVDTWVFRLRQYRPPHQFDDLIIVVANDMGRTLDAKKLRLQHYERWLRELALMPPNHDFVVEARKLIEQALLSETIRVLPITGEDLLREFSLQPGPEIGRLLKEAKRLYDAEPCSAEELLAKLRAGKKAD